MLGESNAEIHGKLSNKYRMKLGGGLIKRPRGGRLKNERIYATFGDKLSARDN